MSTTELILQTELEDFMTISAGVQRWKCEICRYCKQHFVAKLVAMINYQKLILNRTNKVMKVAIIEANH